MCAPWTRPPSAPVAEGPRSRGERRHGVEERLAHDVDAWVATAAPAGAPHLVPLSFDWDGETLVLATPAGSVTGRSLATTGTVRLALGHTRDVCMIDGAVEVLPIDALPAADADRFAARSGFDPRVEPTPYRRFRVTPCRVQAWREVDELAGRDLMRDGRWLA